MHLSRSLSFIALLLSFFALSACDDTTKTGAGKYGMMDTNIPEYAAVQFFSHIYEDDNIEGALDFASPKMARLMKSYRINRNVQRHVLNMAYDKVEIKPNATNAGRNEFAKEASVALFFEGTLNGEIVKDLRTVKLVRIKKAWKVDEVSVE
ncbi:putative lipoprotein [Paraglaciecola sp. T6c]|uniref:hypothetical protein n=1 Tax=Pseudoalteromonas atlantica (strain T6c / ATCC BAA-1087) TaxID=3042615 RepID=UPI00005C67A5|nr:hypothetical protein [Paraglaciecola sp. T6c]ABG41034.1 putative lipoprotein [Paraglaciecola sp. T6c]